MKVLLGIAAHLIVAVLLTAPLAAQPLSRSVLLLNQSDAGFPFETALATAVRLTLNAESKVPISFYAEHLDANRFFGSDYEEGILSFFRKKYRDKVFDVVVVVGSAALDFITRRRPELWPNVPVVFAAIDEATIAKVTLPPNVTGVTMQLTLQDMVRTANIVVPDLKRIAIVGDPLERQTFYRHLLDEIPTVVTQYEIINLMNFSMSELRRRLGNLPDATAVIYTGIFYDNEGVSHIPARDGPTNRGMGQSPCRDKSCHPSWERRHRGLHSAPRTSWSAGSAVRIAHSQRGECVRPARY